KGILRLVLTAGLMALTFGPMVVFLILREPPDPAMARAFLEPAIFLFTMVILIGSGTNNNGVFFTPPEVDFLFSGPFNRRELILYRIGHQAQASLFGALFLSVAPTPFVPSWIFAFLGIALVLQFIQLLSTVLSLTISIVGQSAYTRARKAVLILVGVVIVLGLVQAAANQPVGDPIAILQEFARTPIGRIVLAPFQLFSRTIAAERFFPDFLAWGSLALGLNAALLVLTLRLDTDFYERSAAVSEKVYRALENARRGQAWMSLSKPSVMRWRVPMPARLRGAGPVAWRQAVGALRASRGIIYVVLSIAGIVMLALYLLPDTASGMAGTALIMFALFTFPQMLQFDFRGDIERVDLLKTLPASAGAIVMGELMVPIASATIVEWAIVLVAGPLWTDWSTVLAICAFLPLANLIVFALENLIFLYYPRRTGNAGTPFQAPGRQMVINFLKVTTVSIAAGITVGFGALVFWVSDSMVAALSAAWCVAALLGAVLVPQVARAFRVLDPSLETME
ncbi:MAG TPA: putative ABC exporter domain-containing protein, partial [Terriglobia bacterium]|nr:putative ABC exporter domain-containing protein [Terriglobia bacterium]